MGPFPSKRETYILKGENSRWAPRVVLWPPYVGFGYPAYVSGRVGFNVDISPLLTLSTHCSHPPFSDMAMTSMFGHKIVMKGVTSSELG